MSKISNNAEQEESIQGASRQEPSSDREIPHPVYEKPVIRKYDQIDQVKPYGPSDLEAG